MAAGRAGREAPTVARIDEIVRYLRESLWFIPGLFAIGSLLLGALLVFIDAEVGQLQGGLWFVYLGSVEGAQAVLSTIAMSMLTFTGLVFSITMLVLQSASNQLSPRVLRTFLRDRGNQVVLGLFVATFLFALFVLRYTRAAGEDQGGELVPGLSIGAAFVLLVASIGAFIYYIDHMAQAIRASTVIHNIAEETRVALEELFPEWIGEPPEDEESPDDKQSSGEPADVAIEAAAAVPADRPAATVRAASSGVVAGVDEHRLLEAAGSREDSQSDERFVEMLPLIGDYVAEGSPIFRVWGDWSADELKGLRRAVQTGRERTLEADAAFGIRQLVDIALRALSPGVNDPTTAVQAVDRIHDILHRLAQRRIPSPLRRDASGRARLYLRRPGWEDYVLLAVEEIRLAGEGQVHLMRRLRQMVLDILEVAPPYRQPPLEQVLERLDRSVGRGLDDPIDRRIARPTDAMGQGPMVS